MKRIYSMYLTESKVRRQVQRSILIMILCLSLVSAFISNAEEKGVCSVTPPTLNEKIRLVNYAHTSNPELVLNIYSSSPSLGDNVTTYTWSNNETQWWRNIQIGYKDPNDSETKYYRLEVYNDTSATNINNNNALSLNFNQATTKCTIYPWASNVTDDYELKWLVGNFANYAFRIKLYNRPRLLGVTNATIGTQCYWYTFANDNMNNATAEENWLFYTVL